MGLGLLTAIVVLVRNYRKLDNYIYLLGVLGVIMLIVAIVFGHEINGARLWLKVGGFSIQPGEFSKVLITIFLAGYLNSNRELLSTSTWRVLRVPMPPLKYLGPLVTMWGMSFALLLLMNDLGSSLLFFGIFLAMIYVATGRLTYPVIGGLLFMGGAWLAYNLKPTVQIRVSTWLNPWQDVMDTEAGTGA